MGYEELLFVILSFTCVVELGGLSESKRLNTTLVLWEKLRGLFLYRYVSPFSLMICLLLILVLILLYLLTIPAFHILMLILNIE